MRISGYTTKQEIVDWGKLHTKEQHNLCSDIIKILKPRRTNLADRILKRREVRATYGWRKLK
jgi:hypothetical protein